MFSFTVWSMVEAISIWLTNYVDGFIVDAMLSQYYLGLYKTSAASVGQIMGLIAAITMLILFSALSRLQNEGKEFQNLFFRFQKLVGLWALTSSITIVLSHYCSEVFLAKRKPKLSVLSQFIHIIILWPAVLML